MQKFLMRSGGVACGSRAVRAMGDTGELPQDSRQRGDSPGLRAFSILPRPRPGHGQAPPCAAGRSVRLTGRQGTRQHTAQTTDHRSHPQTGKAVVVAMPLLPDQRPDHRRAEQVAARADARAQPDPGLRPGDPPPTGTVQRSWATRRPERRLCRGWLPLGELPAGGLAGCAGTGRNRCPVPTPAVGRRALPGTPAPIGAGCQTAGPVVNPARRSFRREPSV